MSSSHRGTRADYRAFALAQAQASSPHTLNLSHFQCGDKSHDVYRSTPELESRIRHNCTLPKIHTISKHEKCRTVTTIVHRALVTAEQVMGVHKQCEAQWKKIGGKMWKATSKPEEKALADRKELEEDDWEVIDDADVDDSLDVKGEWSGKKVLALDSGLQ